MERNATHENALSWAGDKLLQRNFSVFAKFGSYSKVQFENCTRLMHEFLETLALPKKSALFIKNKLKLRKSNPVVAAMACY